MSDLGESPTLRDVVRIYEIALRSIDRDTKYAETAIATASAALAHGEKLKSSARELVVPSPQPAESESEQVLIRRLTAEGRAVAEDASEVASECAWAQFTRMPSSNPGDYARHIVRALDDAGLLVAFCDWAAVSPLPETEQTP